MLCMTGNQRITLHCLLCNGRNIVLPCTLQQHDGCSRRHSITQAGGAQQACLKNTYMDTHCSKARSGLLQQKPPPGSSSKHRKIKAVNYEVFPYTTMCYGHNHHRCTVETLFTTEKHARTTQNTLEHTTMVQHNTSPCCILGDNRTKHTHAPTLCTCNTTCVQHRNTTLVGDSMKNHSSMWKTLKKSMMHAYN